MCQSAVADTAEHTLLECDYFKYGRRKLQENIERVETPEDLMAAMLGSAEGWNTGRRFAEDTMVTKEAVEMAKARTE